MADGGKSDKTGPAKAALADFCTGQLPSYLTFVFLMTAPLPVLFPHASVASQRGGDGLERYLKSAYIISSAKDAADPSSQVTTCLLLAAHQTWESLMEGWLACRL